MNSQAFQLRRAFADLERVRMGGYCVEVVSRKLHGKWRKQILVTKDPTKVREKGIWRVYVDETTPGAWQPEFVLMVLEREKKDLERIERRKGEENTMWLPPTVRLSDEEIDIVYEVAKVRESNGEKSQHGHHMSGQPATDKSSHLMGALGEVLARKYFKLPREVYTDIQKQGRGSDDGWDLVYEGLKIDVKYTGYTGPFPGILRGKDYLYSGAADIYLGVQKVGREKVSRVGSFYGWCWREVMDEAVWKENIKEGTSIVDYSLLTTMESFYHDIHHGRAGHDEGQQSGPSAGLSRKSDTALRAKKAQPQGDIFL